MTNHRSLNSFPFAFLALLVAGIFALQPSTAQAQQVPGPHPAYLHALSDLRYARALLHDNWTYPRVQREDDHAIAEIDAAINEIKHAAIDDGKNIEDHPRIDTHLGWRDRFGKANELLARAHHDLDHAEDVPEARGLRNRAIMHIDEAHNTVDRAWRTAHWE